MRLSSSRGLSVNATRVFRPPESCRFAVHSKGREIAGAYIHTYIYTRKRRVILYATSFYDYFVCNTYIVYAFARAHCRRASYTRFRARFTVNYGKDDCTPNVYIYIYIYITCVRARVVLTRLTRAGCWEIIFQRVHSKKRKTNDETITRARVPTHAFKRVYTSRAQETAARSARAFREFPAW